MSQYIFYYILAINILTFFIFGLDKLLSKTKMSRIPEKILLLFCFLGGGIGGFFGMKLFRHKTQHKIFIILVPVSIIITVILIYFIKFKFTWV